MLNLTRKDGFFCLRWTLATAIAIGLCSLLGSVGLFVGPLALAIAQGFALAGYWVYAILWGFATAVGGYAALVAFLGLFLLVPLSLPLSLIVVISSAVMGLAQGSVLRPVSPLWIGWPLFNGIVLLISIGWFVPGATDAAVYPSSKPWWEWVAQATLTGFIGAPLKGLALIWVLKRASGSNEGL